MILSGGQLLSSVALVRRYQCDARFAKLISCPLGIFARTMELQSTLN